ncbi:hypothetical protein Fmac_012544 [Flemingia macrophylla]|uniref:F-box domain-containing protein n=1 Tax=Flemingia macrophylla TaxID=520843 RepID=A0ABD1MQK8_9FABA
MDLISGLPEDVARECLIRVSYHQFPTVASVCKLWNSEIHSPEFHRQRRTSARAQELIVMVQANIEPGTASTKRVTSPVYRLSVFEPQTGNWAELPGPPEFNSGLPMFCQVVGLGHHLVVLGGLDPNSWKASNSVFVYNFLSAEWRRGADMPGGPRTFFACAASDSDATVFVAGGHDNEKNALRSALAYDVSLDRWIPLPDMAAERDECRGVFRRGRFFAVGGYPTDAQGRFEKSAEAFDPATWRWGEIEEGYLDRATCPRTFVDGGDGEGAYLCVAGELMALRRDTWQRIASVPAEVRNAAFVAPLDGALVVIGSSGYGEVHVAYAFDATRCNWRKLETPEGFRGHVQTGCVLEI